MTALGLGCGLGVAAQPPVEWGGLAYLDYRYLLASDDADAVGDNSFDYRRIYLTADIALDDAFRARVRLEAQGRAVTAEGRPSPFVKDAWLQWRYTDSGHRATLGVQPPPVFEVSEAVWGYRSLERTLLDRARVRESRDLGLRLGGPLFGRVRYAAMVGNGNGVSPEAEGARGKRVYGQLAYLPDGPLRATVGADYTESDPDAPLRDASARASVLLGAVTERAQGGVEAFVVVNDLRDPDADAERGVGVSVFGAVTVAPRTSGRRALRLSRRGGRAVRRRRTLRAGGGSVPSHPGRRADAQRGRHRPRRRRRLGPRPVHRLRPVLSPLP